VGNTIDHTPVGMSPGIHISAPDVGSSLTANIFDNLITHSSGGAIQLPPVSSSLVVNNGFNDLFGGPASEFGGYAKGPGTVSVSPRYVNAAAADYQLRPHSPVLGKGEICTPGGLSRSDAAGKYRITGRSLDLGAYELGAGGVPKGSNIFGTAGSDRLKGTGGDDIICGFGGRDTIKAAGGNDLVYGGPGNDRIFGGAGADQLIGGTGHDLLDGGSGADYLNSRDGHRGDTDKGGPGHDHCVADRGDHVSSCP
jgi:Ca2+-binding RTX toxin-like protein